MPKPSAAKCFGHTLRMTRLVAEHEAAHQRSVLPVHGASATINQFVHTICHAMPQRVRWCRGIHRDLAQFALHMAPRHKPQAALVVRHTCGIKNHGVAHAYPPQGTALAAIDREAKLFVVQRHNQ